jgi:hypothetical protein
MRRIAVQSQHETLSWKKNHHKNRAGGVAQDVGPDFKPNTKKKKKLAMEPTYSF